jgi:hypothetical protein
LVTVKILGYDIFKEGLICFKIDANTPIYEILKKINEEYGVAYQKKFNRKFLEDIEVNYRIFVNNNYVETSALIELYVNNDDNILILKPISGG